MELEQGKAKYQSVIDVIKSKGGSLKNVHVENGKLLIRADMPSEATKNDVWSAIKQVDASYSDLTADINIDSSLTPPQRTYTVVKGDSLSKIAKEFYGDPKLYTKIVQANPSITNPDLIHPGDVFVIPD
jgi:nucleoid-associated protein YgaU